MYSKKYRNLIKKAGFKTQKEVSIKLGEKESSFSFKIDSIDKKIGEIKYLCDAIGINILELIIDEEEISKIYNIDPQLIRVCKKIEKLSLKKQIIFLEHLETGLALVEE